MSIDQELRVKYLINLELQSLDDSVAADIYLARFVHLFRCKSYDLCSNIFEILRHCVVDDKIAIKVLVSLMECCRLPKWTGKNGDSLLALLCGFAEQLKSYSHLDVWKAFVLMLMAIAVRVPECNSGRLISLRNLNGTTDPVFVENMPASVPESCTQLVRCGFSLQASLDVQDGISLSTLNLLAVFKMARALMDMYLLYDQEEYLVGCFRILKSALRRDNVRFTDAECDHASVLLEVSCSNHVDSVFQDIFTLMESKSRLKPELDSFAAEMWREISKQFSFDEVIKVFNQLIRRKEGSRLFRLLLATARTFIKSKWPTQREDAAESTFALLRDLVDFLGHLEHYPNPRKEMNLALLGRSFRDQLEVVGGILMFYLTLLYVDGETNYSGLLDAEELQRANAWLSSLENQGQHAQVTAPFERDRHNYVLTILNYALTANADPAFLAKKGLPLW